MRSKRFQILTVHLSLLLLALALSRAGLPAQTAAASRVPGVQKSDKPIDFQTIELPIPLSEQDKAYLGLSGTGSFRVGQLKSRVLLIEIFSFYCIHCQRTAPRVNEVFQEIQKRPALRDNVKMIGIGVGNSPLEVKSYKEKFQVPFPVFPDQSMNTCKALGIEATPTFIGVRKNEAGLAEQFYFEEGEFENAAQFLEKFTKLAGLGKEAQE